MKKIFGISLFISLLLGAFSVQAMESTQQKILAQGGNFFKALYSGLRSHKSKALKSNQMHMSVALDVIKLIMDCNDSNLYAKVHTRMYDTKELSDLIAPIQRAIDLSEKQKNRLKPSNIIKMAGDAQKFVSFINNNRQMILAELLKTEYLQKADNPLKIITSDLVKQYLYEIVNTNFKNVLSVLFLGLQDATIKASIATDKGHYGKVENQLGSLAEIEVHLEDIAKLDKHFSQCIKKAIIDQLVGKIEQILSRAGYIVEHMNDVQSENSEDEMQSTQEKKFYRWDLKGLAFELEMLIKIVGLEKVVGKLTHYNFTITDEKNNYREITEFDMITEKAVFEVKAAFLAKNNVTQMNKAQNQIRNQFAAMEKHNLPRMYIFIGSTSSLSKAYFDHVLNFSKPQYAKLNKMPILFMNNTDIGYLKERLEEARSGQVKWCELPSPSVNPDYADKLRKISSRAQFLKSQLGIPIRPLFPWQDDSTTESESSSERMSIDSSNNNAWIATSTADEEPVSLPLENTQKTQNSSLQDLPANIKYVMRLIKGLAYSESYFGNDVRSKL